MDYDVMILGGGIIGCALAYELSKYSLNIALIEKDYDIADDVAFINSSVVYDGVECENDLAAKLEMNGNKLMEQISKKFKIPFKRTGSLIIAKNDDEVAKIENMHKKALERGIKNIEILNKDEVEKIEPNLNMNLKKALYSKNTASIAPFDLAISYGEIAFDNGVNFKLEEQVLEIQKLSKGYRIITNKNKFNCNIVINTTPDENFGIYSDTKRNYKMSNFNYLLIEKNSIKEFNNIVMKLSDNENIKKILAVPTVQGNMVLAVDTYKKINYKDTLDISYTILDEINEMDINTFYQFPYYDDSIVIDDGLIDNGYIKVIINHYGQVTMTPYIAKIITETIVNNIKCVLKKEFIDKRRDYYKFNELSLEERNKIINMDKRYGKIICACNKVTEGEIIDAIRRPLGARTLEGIKRRTGAAFGSCQGTYCLNKLASILARETNKFMTDIVKDSKNSKITPCRIKEFDTI
ncbi:FAD-dependent oxidoreductase [Clostridium sp. Marseille-Q2269]|uniref:NAD(P)/FAD-dependent oxidoreductase n=1 Tax=Clostridium sp. Marseille-Q2269 TaxID=2942205 RepID=UPI0020743AE7|nr:FAD-dependent oxidoreductase [Clostridium sp. Marseille-Q2269]